MRVPTARTCRLLIYRSRDAVVPDSDSGQHVHVRARHDEARHADNLIHLHGDCAHPQGIVGARPAPASFDASFAVVIGSFSTTAASSPCQRHHRPLRMRPSPERSAATWRCAHRGGPAERPRGVPLQPPQRDRPRSRPRGPGCSGSAGTRRNWRSRPSTARQAARLVREHPVHWALLPSTSAAYLRGPAESNLPYVEATAAKPSRQPAALLSQSVARKAA